MEDAILNFTQQFTYTPQIINAEKFEKRERFIVVGMGGSHLAAGLVKIWKPSLDIHIRRTYGLPPFDDTKLRTHTFIASSYSGNTEEVVGALKEAIKKRLNAIVISTGGYLIEIAKEHSLPYIQLPDTGIQPRSALGFSLMAFLRVLGEERELQEVKKLGNILDPALLEDTGRLLAEKMRGHIPIVYASFKNKGIAYNWKIKFNETGKIPSFYNVFPELNHNEMTGFDSKKELVEKFYFLFIEDLYDHPRIQKRMKVLAGQLKNRGLNVESLSLAGKTVFERIFTSLLLADWTALYTAKQYGLESEQVPMIEEFKKLIV